MKIALIIENFDLAAGGNERSTEQIARQLGQRGHHVTILTNRSTAPGNVDEAGPGGARVIAAGGLDTKFALGLWRFAKWARRQIKVGGYDVSMSVTTAVPATIVQPRSGTARETLERNVAMRRGALRRAIKRLSIALSPKQRVLLWLERRTLHHPEVKRVVAISRYVADQLFHHYTLSMRRVMIIPNAAEVRRFDPAERERLRGEARRRLGLGPNDVVFLFAARNPGLKGLGPLLEATARTRRGSDRVRVIVAGTLVRRGQRHARRLGIEDLVRFVGPTREMDVLYAASDVTVLPTWYDPASKVVLESLLHGIPAITTRHNGAADWILDPTGEATQENEGEKGVGSLYSEKDSRPLFPGPGGVRGGRVIDSPAAVDELATAMIELCDDAERARCAAATAGLDQLISMDRHVDDLEKLMMHLTAVDDRGHAGGGASISAVS